MIALIFAALSLLPPVLVEGEKGATIAERMRHYNVPAVSIAIWKDGKIVSTRACGDATAATRFQAGSISKTLTAVAVLREVEANKIRLDENVDDALKSWKIAHDGVTIERVLSHSAGLNVPGFAGYEPGEAIPTTIEELQTLHVDVEPGTELRYSGGGYLLLQQMLADLEQRSFESIMKRLVLDPAGMTQSTYEQRPRIDVARGLNEQGQLLGTGLHMYPELAAAGLWTTPRDLAKFLIALQTRKLLARTTLDRMLTPIAISHGRMGLGAFIVTRRGHTWFAHPGGNDGFYAIYYASREKPEGAVVMTNADSGEGLAGEIIRGIARQYQWTGFLPDPLKLARLTREQLAPLAGRYAIDADDVLTVRRAGDHLVASHTLGSEFRLDPTSSTHFIRRDNDEEEFDFDKMERATSFVPAELLQHGDVIEALSRYRTMNADDEHLRDVARKTRSLDLLELNTEMHPKSSAAFDALASLQESLGDKSGARESSRRVLQLLRDDITPTVSWRAAYRRNAERRLR